MRIDTASGLHGELIAYSADYPDRPEIGGRAIVRRDESPFPNRQFSTHTVYEMEGKLYATNGAYDLTWTEAQNEFAGLWSAS